MALRPSAGRYVRDRAGENALSRPRVLLATAVATLGIAVSVAGAAPPPTLTPGELLVGVNLGQPGFQGGAVRDGTTVVFARGFEIDLARQLGKRLDTPVVRFVHERSFLKLTAAGHKPWDVALAAVTITKERARRVDFSVPYMTVDQGVLVRKGLAAPRSLAALAKLRLCYERGTTGGLLVTQRIEPTTKAVSFATFAGVLSGVRTGRCDAAVSDLPLLGVERAEARDRYGALAGRIKTRERYGIVLSKGSPLRRAIDSALRAITADGTVDRLEKKWLSVELDAVPVLR